MRRGGSVTPQFVAPPQHVAELSQPETSTPSSEWPACHCPLPNLFISHPHFLSQFLFLGNAPGSASLAVRVLEDKAPCVRPQAAQQPAEKF